MKSSNVSPANAFDVGVGFGFGFAWVGFGFGWVVGFGVTFEGVGFGVTLACIDEWTGVGVARGVTDGLGACTYHTAGDVSFIPFICVHIKRVACLY